MADTYLVTAEDVSGELKNLFTGGFSATTTPTKAQVESAISTADTMVTMAVQDVTSVTPAATDKAAVIAKRYVIEWVKKWVLGIVWLGNDPARVAEALKPYGSIVTEISEAITLLGSQAAGTGEAGNRVLVPSTYPTRALIVDDTHLDGDTAYRTRQF